jgi:hypothetical protein
MEPSYWIEPLKEAALLAEIMHALRGDSHIAVEAAPEVLSQLGLTTIPNGVRGPVHPFRVEYPDAKSEMLVLPLSDATLSRLCGQLCRNRGTLRKIGAIQVERARKVEFLAGDNFHPDCVSVGSGVAVELLEDMQVRGIIAAYRTPGEARARLPYRD